MSDNTTTSAAPDAPAETEQPEFGQTEAEQPRAHKRAHAHAELMALLQGINERQQRARPVPRFFPAPPPGQAPVHDRHAPEPEPQWLRRNEAWDDDENELPMPVAPRRRSRHGGQRRTTRSRSRGASRQAWLAAALFVVATAAGGVGLFYLAQTNRDLPGLGALAGLTSSLTSSTAPVASSAKGDQDEAAVAVLQPVQPATAVPTVTPTVARPEPALTPVPAKPVSTAHVEVADVSGQVMDQIPVRLAVTDPGNGEDMAFYLTGLPETVSLSSGTRNPDGSWVVAAAESGGLRLMSTTPTAEPVSVGVVAVDRKTGQMAAPLKEMQLVVNAPVASPGSSAKADGLADSAAILTDGLEALLGGNIENARQSFRKALDLGERRAIAHLARTYDPIVLARLDLKDVAADKDKAISWYRRAIEAGDDSVSDDMAALQKLKPVKN